jgi:hypothetical protein
LEHGLRDRFGVPTSPVEFPEAPVATASDCPQALVVNFGFRGSL